ncbi:hypothetical protein [Pseudomonas sp. TWI929]|uniref:hypothetical protein n=1 Tax=Pseudomonas sp. TWI929 TaxID=3136795 RepID=UPI00320AE67A
MDTNKLREQFEKAFVEEQVRLCGEGFRSSALYMIEQNVVTVRMAWWAWQASREAVVVELPEPDLPEAYLDEPVDRESEEFRYLEARHGAQSQIYRKCRKAIEAQGLKVEVKP